MFVFFISLYDSAYGSSTRCFRPFVLKGHLPLSLVWDRYLAFCQFYFKRASLVSVYFIQPCPILQVRICMSLTPTRLSLLVCDSWLVFCFVQFIVTFSPERRSVLFLFMCRSFDDPRGTRPEVTLCLPQPPFFSGLPNSFRESPRRRPLRSFFSLRSQRASCVCSIDYSPQMPNNPRSAPSAGDSLIPRSYENASSPPRDPFCFFLCPPFSTHFALMLLFGKFVCQDCSVPACPVFGSIFVFPSCRLLRRSLMLSDACWCV